VHRVGTRIGIQLGPAEPGGPPLHTVARAVEAHGFDSLWLGEHLLWHAPFLEPLVALGYAAAATERLRLGTSAVILPLHHPLRLAKAGATLDRLSGGRFELGVGVGGENPAEFAAMDVPVRERGRRADEALPLLRRLWSGEPVDHAGHTTTLRGARLDPPPATSGGPRIWVAGRSGAARVRAARWGDGWLPYLVTPEQVDAGATEVRTLAAAAGRPRPLVGVHLFVALGVADAAASELGSFLGRLYGPDLASPPPGRCLVGPDDEVAARAAAYRDAGADHLLLQPLGWDPAVVDRIAALAPIAALLRGSTTTTPEGVTA
jgi:probable F420-dependent oxidoreductase